MIKTESEENMKCKNSSVPQERGPKRTLGGEERARMAAVGRASKQKLLDAILAVATEPEKRKILSIPDNFRHLSLKSMNGTASPRQAIKAHCYSCVGWEEILENVGNCQIRSCALWSYRPKRKVRNGDAPN